MPSYLPTLSLLLGLLLFLTKAFRGASLLDSLIGAATVAIVVYGAVGLGRAVLARSLKAAPVKARR